MNRMQTIIWISSRPTWDQMMHQVPLSNATQYSHPPPAIISIQMKQRWGTTTRPCICRITHLWRQYKQQRLCSNPKCQCSLSINNLSSSCSLSNKSPSQKNRALAKSTGLAQQWVIRSTWVLHKDTSKCHSTMTFLGAVLKKWSLRMKNLWCSKKALTLAITASWTRSSLKILEKPILKKSLSTTSTWFTK